MKKKLMSLLLTATLTLSMSSALTSVSADDSISVVLNGQKLQFEVEPQIINDYTMVPMRAIFEALGYTVAWIEKDRSVFAVNTNEDVDRVIQLWIDQTLAINCSASGYQAAYDKNEYMNNNIMVLQQAPVIMDGSTLVPVRAVSEFSGCSVEWDENTKTVTINNGDNSAAVMNSFGDIYNIPSVYSSTKIQNNNRIYMQTFIYREDYNASYINSLISNGFWKEENSNRNRSDEEVFINTNGIRVLYRISGEGTDYPFIYYSYEIPKSLNIIINTHKYYDGTTIPTYDSITGMEFTREASNVYGYEFDSASMNLYCSYLKTHLGYTLYSSNDGLTFISPDYKYVVNIDSMAQKSGIINTVISPITLK